VEANNYRSAEIGEIMGALSKAQGTYKKPIPNEEGPRGKFANLEAILEAVRESLASNGLGFFQSTERLDEGSGVRLLWTSLGHSSNQYISSCARIVSASSERSTGNLERTIRRRQAEMILGIAPSKNSPDFDDDGDLQAEERLIEMVRKPKEPSKEAVDRHDVVNATQYQELLIELDGYEAIAKDIMEKHGIDTLADLPREYYHQAQAQIRKIKKVDEEYTKRKR
jgi:hypothetical protein